MEPQQKSTDTKMRHSLHLEWIGANTREEDKMCGLPYDGPWVAKLSMGKYNLKREFLKSMIDYSKSNSVGSRGVYLYFILSPGFYEVKERISWKNSRRYFLCVEDSDHQREVEKWEVEVCLKNVNLKYI